MVNTLTTVDFHGQNLLVTLIDGKPAVALRPVCDALGLDWRAQLQRIKRHPVLESTVVVITTVAQDGKQRESTCLPLNKLNGWLFGISASRVKPELRERLIQYQRECFDVLACHFGSQQPALPNACITPEQAGELSTLIAERFPDGRDRPYAWGRFNNHFRIALTYKYGRWLFCMDWNGADPAPYVKRVDNDAMIVSLAKLPSYLADPGLLATSKELADISAACCQRLAQRMANPSAAPARRLSS